MAVNTFQTAEKLVGAAVLQLDGSALANRQYIEIVNNGDNTIWMQVGTAAPGSISPRGGIPLPPGETWLMPLGPSLHVYAVSPDVAQTTGEGTIVNEYGP